MNEQFFTSLNGYKVKDEYAVHTYDSVALMKIDSKLKEGMYVKTKGYYNANDGGHGDYIIVNNDTLVADNGLIHNLTNGLKAKLIINNDCINVKQFGVTDNNFSNILNYLLTKSYEIYIPKENFIITETINIENDHTRLVCDGDLSCNDDIPFFNVTGEYCNISLNGTITGGLNNDEFTGTVIKIGSSNKSVGHNVININKINSVKEGVLFAPNGNYGCHYNKINFNYIQATYGIHFKAGNTSTPWINENTFYGGRLLGGTGILTEKGENQTDRYNGNKFINIGYERLNCAIDLHYAFYNFFDRCRMNESLLGNYWIKCDENAINNTFTLESALRYDKIYDISTGINNKNIYNVNVYDDNGNWLGNKMYSSEGYFIIPKDNCLQPNRLIINGYNKEGTYNITTNHIPVYTEEATLYIGSDYGNKTINYTIPKEVFNERKIRKINICVGYKEISTTINIYDSNNTLLVSNAQFGESKLDKAWFELKYKYIPINNYKTWRLSKLETSEPS